MSDLMYGQAYDFLNNIHALPGTTNHERTGQHIVLSYKRLKITL